MIKYLKIAWIIIKNAYIRDSKIPGMILSKTAFQFLEIVITVVFFDVIFANTKTLAGWNFYQVLFLYAFAKVIISINNTFSRGGMKDMANDLVRRGNFDFYLTKPVNPMILISISKPQIYQLIALVFEIGLCVWAVVAGSISVNFWQVFWFLILAFWGVLLYYFLSVLTITPVFWFIRLWSLQEVMGRLNQVMRYPIGVFPTFVRIALMSVFPIIAVAYIPVSALFGEMKIEYIVYIVAITAVFGLITKYVWELGEKHYSSASS